MKARHLVGVVILAATTLQVAEAHRSISTDNGDYADFDSADPNNGATVFTQPSQSFDIDGLTLTFAPGISTGGGVSGAEFTGDGSTNTWICPTPTTCGPGYAINPDTGAMFNWGTNPSSQTPGPLGVSEQVVVYSLSDGLELPVIGSSSETFTTSGAFEVDFNYYSSSCAGETASLAVGAQTFTVGNPCAGGDNAFFFNDAGGELVLEGTPSGWAGGTSAAAPEMDPRSALAGLSLLLGGLAVFLGKRSPPLTSS